MKLGKIILTGVIATALTSVSFAQTAETAIAPNPVQEETTIALANNESEAAKEIKISELPAAVQQSLKTDAYKGWKATRAWIVQKDKKNLYKVEVANEEDKTQNLLFDENGIVID